ncbi:histone RNA hairpin-binding protein isoform X2 [Nematostella vectensis]|uniref:histone RNA hairpin-binding protein isoform X2 n=1 Tax=Nematostella vectensis TaxID=45351 RepID=UPI0013905276|nr:histone RNA hairpin-binding protein isoform X2 [Nematostella vectensis]
MEVERTQFPRRRTQRKDDESSACVPRRGRNSKRSYQRDSTRRRGSYEEPTSPVVENDLRSPCHKQPRFKGEKENAERRKCTPVVSHRWSKNRVNDYGVEHKSPLTLCNKEFPPLGFDFDRYTPESNKDWATMVEEEEQQKDQPTQITLKDPSRFKRKLLLTDPKDQPTSNKPTVSNKSMETDLHKLEKRQKQIDIGKNTVAYGRFSAQIPREKRAKEDPSTPDKFQQCSTRSWVGQVRVWRRRLHSWDPPSGSEDLFSHSPSSQSETNMDIDAALISKPEDPDDLFKGFDIDACLLEDGITF